MQYQISLFLFCDVSEKQAEVFEDFGSFSLIIAFGCVILITDELEAKSATRRQTEPIQSSEIL